MSSTATTLLWSRFFSSAPDLTYALCWVISLHVNAQHFMLPSMQQEVTTPQPSAVPQSSKNSWSSKFPTSRIQIEISWQPENHYKKRPFKWANGRPVNLAVVLTSRRFASCHRTTRCTMSDRIGTSKISPAKIAIPLSSRSKLVTFTSTSFSLPAYSQANSNVRKSAVDLWSAPQLWERTIWDIC